MSTPIAKNSVARSKLGILLSSAAFMKISESEGLGDGALNPKWGHLMNDSSNGCYVFAYLPKELVGKWIQTLASSPNFRKSVNDEVISAAQLPEFGRAARLEITWNGDGPSFNVIPGSPASIYPELYKGRYSDHNVDFQWQADLLATCLIIYLSKLYPALLECEADPSAFPDSRLRDLREHFVQAELEGFKRILPKGSRDAYELKVLRQ